MSKEDTNISLLGFIEIGEIITTIKNDTYLIYTRTKNRVISINEDEYTYLNQDYDTFLFSEEINNTIINKLQFNNLQKNIKRNLHINLSSPEKESLLITIDSILRDYNIYRKIYIIIDINQSNLFFIKELIKWFNGYERLVIVCRIDSRKRNLIADLKKFLKEIVKKTTIKIFVENYVNISSTNSSLIDKNIKLSPILFSSQKSENIENLFSNFSKTKNILKANKMIKSNLAPIPVTIKTVSENEVINSDEDIINKCNTCWAKNLCHQNGLYRMFSNHPYICSINTTNCFLIKKFTLSCL